MFCVLSPPQAENFAVFGTCYRFSAPLRANSERNLPTNFGDYSRSNLIYPQIFKNLWVITAKKNTVPELGEGFLAVGFCPGFLSRKSVF